MTTKRTINTPHDTAQAVSDIGVKHCINRLYRCQDLRTLKRRWDALAIAYQNDPRIAAVKDELKGSFE